MMPLRPFLQVVVSLAALALPAQAGSFFSNFNDGETPPGMTLSGDATVASAGMLNAVLKLTTATNNRQGNALLPDLDGGNAIYGFDATFKLLIGDGTSPPADGFSFCFASVWPASGWGEEGTGTGLCFSFDIFDNGSETPLAPSIDVAVGGTKVATRKQTIASITTTYPSYADVHIRLNADGSLVMDYKGVNLFTNFFIPGYQPMPGNFGLGARTGALNANHWVDDLQITTFLQPLVGISTQPFSQKVLQGNDAVFDARITNPGGVTLQWFKNGNPIPGATGQTLIVTNVAPSDSGSKYKVTATGPNNTTTSSEATLTVTNLDLPSPQLSFNFDNVLIPPGTSNYGSAFVSSSGGINNSGALKLTSAGNNQSGAFVVADKDFGASVYGFTARFQIRVGGGTTPPADGWAFAFGTDIPTDPTSGGPHFEDGAGLGTGLVITADLYNDDGIYGAEVPPAPSIDVRFGGQVIAIAQLPLSFLETGNSYADTVIQLATNGALTLVYRGAVLFDNLQLPFVSIAGGRYALAARTGALTENIWIDNFQLTTVSSATGQSSAVGAYTFTTFAGQATIGSTDGIGGLAQFNVPESVAVDAAGNLFVADFGSHTIRKISPAGEVTTIAGFPGIYGASDGTNRTARFNAPAGIAVDKQGNVYVADSRNYTIRKITPAGTNWVVTTIAGLTGASGTNDGVGTNALFSWAGSLAVDGGTNIFVADSGAGTIRKIAHTDTNWVVSTIAGTPGQFGTNDGLGTAALFSALWCVAVDNSGIMYVADNQTIRKLGPNGTNWNVTTIAGLAGVEGGLDDTNARARFNYPGGIATDTNGNVYVAEVWNHSIRKLTMAGPDWVVSTLAGSNGLSGYADGTGGNARFFNPSGIAVDDAGDIYVSDSVNRAIRGITSAGVVHTIAGAVGSRGNVNGAGSQARFSGPMDVAADTAGNLYVSERDNRTIRRITPGGLVTTLAGSATAPPEWKDGVGDNAHFSGPVGVAVDTAQNIYVADTDSHTIRKLTPAGVVTTIAGVPYSLGSNDGMLSWGQSGPRFWFPGGIAVDRAGNVYVADQANGTIRRITPVGTDWSVSTIAGTPGVFGTNDDVGSSARFGFVGSFYLMGLAVDSSTNIYLADGGNAVIRRIAPVGPNWVVTTIAGRAGRPGTNDGLGAAARFGTPTGIAVDSSANLYVADQSRLIIRKIKPLAGGWMVTTIGGLGGLLSEDTVPGSADGTGSAARFASPSGVAVDALGSVYITDYDNNTIRKGVFSQYGSANPVSYTRPTPTNALVVTFDPEAPGGGWRFAWEYGWHTNGEVVSNLFAGNYAIEFRHIPGWLAFPPSYVVPVTNNGTTFFTGHYYPTTESGGNGGTLTVNFGFSPPPGVGWRFLGDSLAWPAYPPGYTTNLLAGTYLLEFAPISGFSKPPNQAVEVVAGQTTVLGETYLMARPGPAEKLFPFPVPEANIGDVTNYPFGFNGQLQSDVGYGSGVAVSTNVVLTAAHLLFDDQTLSYASQAYWFWQQAPGSFAQEPLLGRSFFVLTGYAGDTNTYALQRSNDVRSGHLAPGQSSPLSRNLDVAAIYFDRRVAGGGSGGYLPSDVVPNPWLTGTALKMLVGYPVDASEFGDYSIVPGKMYQTEPQPYRLSLANDPILDQRVYVADWFLSYAGNSGGPLYVQYNGYYYPAGVYLGTLYSGSEPYASAVRAIDSNVVNLITIAANEGNSGTNHTGGGVITIIPGAVSTSNPGYIQFQLAPTAAVQAGAAWRVQGDIPYSTATNYTRAVTSTNAFTVQFKQILGWNLPTNQTVTVLPGQITTYTAFYTVTNPVLVANAAFGIGITGTPGTVYRIETRSSLATGIWLTLSTNTIPPTGSTSVSPGPSAGQSSTFYRAVWLQR